MPGYVIHLSAAKAYMKKHKGSIKDPKAFLRGVIAPDMLKKPESHYGKDTANPGLGLYIDSSDMTNEFNKGYFFHLLTDYLFYNKYLENFEWTPEVYNDYDRLNKLLMEDYKIEIPEDVKSVVKFKDDPLRVFNYESMKGFIEAVGSIDLDECIKKRNFDKVYRKKVDKSINDEVEV